MRCTKFTLVSCALLTASMLLNGCSIRDETSEEIMVEDQGEEIVLKQPRTKTEFFIQKCIECAAGDLTYLDEIVETYNSTFTNTTDYPHGAFLYQRMKPTQAFESCAIKALLEGNRMPYDNIIVRPNKIARVARYFYAYNQPTQGAYWLQRIVNIRGEVNGLEVAGRVFIQDTRTIGIGVQLLEQSARLGNRVAGQMLTGLMTPGSPYYTQLTTNTSNDADKSKSSVNEDNEQKADDISDMKNNLDALINERKKKRSVSSKAASGLTIQEQASPAESQNQNPAPAASSVINIFDSENNASAKAQTNKPAKAKATVDEAFSGANITKESQDISSVSKANGRSKQPDASPISARTANKEDNATEVKGNTNAAESKLNEAGDKSIPNGNTAQGYSLQQMPSEAVTEDILNSSDAELNIPLEFYEKKAKDQASTTDSQGSQVIAPKADKDIKEAHQRLIERHEERLKQAKEKAEAAAAAVSNQQDNN